MKLFKMFSRKLIFPTVVSLGLEKYISKYSANKCLILNYHGVVKNFDLALSKNHMPAEQFKKHLSYFKREFNVISLSDIFHLYQNDITPDRNTIAITFDDGYENNFTNALPILQAFGFPATIFVTAEILLNPNEALWYDQIDILKTKESFSSFKNYLKESYPQITNIESFSSLKEHFKDLNADKKKFLLDIINSRKEYKESIYSCNKEYWKMMSAEQIKIISSETNVEIGSHSVSHSNLDRLNEDMLRDELKSSKEILERCISKNIDSIAFPDGAYNEKAKEISIESGYTKLLAVKYHLDSDKKDFSILPRLSISNTTTFESTMITIHRSFNTLGF